MTAPKPRAKITPEPKVKVAPKLKWQAPLGLSVGGSSSQEPKPACKSMSSEEILADIYTPEIPGLARHENPDPAIEEAGEINAGVASTAANMPMRGDGRELGIESTKVQAPIQGELLLVESSTIPEDPQEEIEEMEFTLKEPEIPMRPMIA